MTKPTPKDFPHTWGWKIPQIEAALCDPSTPAHILEELRAMERIATEDLKNDPALKLYRAHADLLRQLPALRGASLDEALDTVQTVRSHAAKKAARSKTEPAWHAEVRAEAKRLLGAGMHPRNVASKIERSGRFPHTIEQIRSVLRSSRK